MKTTTKTNHEIEYYKLSFALINYNYYELLGIFLSCYEDCQSMKAIVGDSSPEQPKFTVHLSGTLLSFLKMPPLSR